MPTCSQREFQIQPPFSGVTGYFEQGYENSMNKRILEPGKHHPPESMALGGRVRIGNACRYKTK